MKTHQYDHFRKEVKEVLHSKVDEFHMLGYDSITEDIVWEYLTNKKWRRPKEDIHIYEIVNDIYTLKVSDVVSYSQIEYLKGPDWFSDQDSDDWKALLKK